jgi:hypothetical protein
MLELDPASLIRTSERKTDGARVVLAWRVGCQYLAAGDTALAVNVLSQQVQTSAPILHAALAVAVASQNDKINVERHLMELYGPWANDARLPIVLGQVSALWSDFNAAREALVGVAAQLNESQEKRLIGELLSGDDPGFDELQRNFRENWKKELDELYIAKRYYYVLLFTSRFTEAVDFSQQMTQRYDAFPQARSAWREHTADALALGGNKGEAINIYQTLSQQCPACNAVRRKLQDLML